LLTLPKALRRGPHGVRGLVRRTGQPKSRTCRRAHGEEPCISGKNGSGAVFFSHCPLGCVYCQNEKISTGGFGKEITPQNLADIFLSLAALGVHNVDLVTPTHFAPLVLRALDKVRHRLPIPIVMNSGGYERPKRCGCSTGTSTYTCRISNT
jgi:putative pyruvate formate lyase activating enzyme